MRTKILLSLLLAATCQTASPQSNQKRLQKTQQLKKGESPDSYTQFLFLQPDSPITVQDTASIHFSKENAFLILNPATKALTALDRRFNWVVYAVDCMANPLPAGCSADSSPVPLGTPVLPFYVAFYNGNAKVAFLSFPTATDARVATVEPKNRQMLTMDPNDDSAVIVPNAHFNTIKVCTQPNGETCRGTETVRTCPQAGYCQVCIHKIPLAAGGVCM